jgi:hypothetical protein
MSKFDGILTAKSNDNFSKSKSKISETVAKAPESKKPKRIGKRSHPDFTQITAYVKKNTHEDVMRKIYKRQELSELLEDLLTDWLKKS